MPRILRGKIAVAVFVIAAVLAIPAQAQTAPLESGFPLTLEPAVEAYRAGDLARARTIAADISARMIDDRIRREADVLDALILLRSATRADIQDGGARIAAAARSDPAIVERIDVLIALGAGSLELNESAKALDHLDLAWERLNKAGDCTRLPLVARLLVRAWMQHAEWSATPPRLAAPAMDTAEQMEAFRRRRVTQLLADATRQLGCPEASAAVQLALALVLVDRPADAAEGVDLLKSLGAQPGSSPTLDEARYQLAQQYEKSQRFADAHALYSRLAAGGSDRAAESRQRADELSKPSINLDVPAKIAPDEPFTVGLKARGLTRLHIEARAVDLEKFLRDKRGRLAEALLPTDGAVRLTREIDCGAKSLMDAFDAATLPEPLRCKSPAGALVVFALGVTVGGETLVVRKLVMTGALRCGATLGASSGVIYAVNQSAGSPAPLENGEALFWMQGVTFVPVSTHIVDGVARFALPNEARTATERRWVCLVRSGEQLAYCTGRLASADELHPRPAALLVASPSVIRSGDTLQVAGVLLPTAAAANFAADTLRLSVVDADGVKLDEVPATISRMGAVRASVVVRPEWLASAKVSVILREGGRVVENVRGALSLRTWSADDEGYELKLDAQPVISPVATDGNPPRLGLLPLRMTATFPWGAPVLGVTGSIACIATQVPDADADRDPLDSQVISLEFETDREGRAMVACDVSSFVGVSPPMAIHTFVSSVGWDSRGQTARATSIAFDKPAAAWLDVEPLPLVRGQPLRVFADMLDPAQQYSDDAPTIEVLRGDTIIARLTTEATPRGYGTSPWLAPIDADALTVRGSFPAQAPGAAPLTAQRHLKFNVGDASGAVLVEDVHVVKREGRDFLTARLHRATETRPLFASIGNADPLAAARLAANSAEISIPLPATLPADAQLEIVALDRDGVQSLARSPINRPALQIAVETPSTVLPAATARVRVKLPHDGGAIPTGAVVARLIDSADVGAIAPISDIDSRDFTFEKPVAPAAGELLSAAPPGGSRVSRALAAHPGLVPALFEGNTIWCESIMLTDGAADIDVPVPPRARRYRLLLYALTSAGDGRAAAVLDAREAPEILLDVPRELCTGDRTVVVAGIRAGRTAARGRIALDPGEGLVIESVNQIGGPSLKPDADGCFGVDVPAGAQVRLAIAVEARRAVDSRFAVRITPAQDGPPQSLTADYRVSEPIASAPANSNKPPTNTVLVARSIFRIAPPAGKDVTPRRLTESHLGDWNLMPLSPDDRVAPGDYLLIRDEVSSTQPLTSVTWRQRIPPTFYSSLRKIEGLRTLGQMRRAGRDLLEYTVTQTQPNVAWHEYVVVAVRPGACTIPQPDVFIGKQRQSVSVTPEQTRLIVEN